MFDRAIWFCLWSSPTASQFSPLLGCSDFSCPSLIPAPHSSNNQLLLSARSSAHSCLDGHPVSLSPSFRDDFWSCYWFPKPGHGSCRRAALPVAFHSQHLHFASGLCKQGSLMGVWKVPGSMSWCLRVTGSLWGSSHTGCPGSRPFPAPSGHAQCAGEGQSRSVPRCGCLVWASSTEHHMP